MARRPDMLLLQEILTSEEGFSQGQNRSSYTTTLLSLQCMFLKSPMVLKEGVEKDGEFLIPPLASMI